MRNGSSYLTQHKVGEQACPSHLGPVVSVNQRAIQSDGCIQNLGHRAPFLGLFAQFIELRLAGAWDLGFERQVYGGDRKTPST